LFIYQKVSKGQGAPVFVDTAQWHNGQSKPVARVRQLYHSLFC